jgi:succinyl-diaminopimelate desuccinylase
MAASRKDSKDRSPSRSPATRKTPVNGTIKLLQWSPRAKGRPLRARRAQQARGATGDCIGSAAAVRYPARSNGRTAGPYRFRIALEPRAGYSRLIVAIPGRSIAAARSSINLEFTSVVGNTASNVIPNQARAKFNIRYDLHTPAGAISSTHAWQGLRQPHQGPHRLGRNQNVFVTKPGPFTDLAVAIEEVTGAAELSMRRHLGCTLHLQLLSGDRVRSGRPDHAPGRRAHAVVDLES